MLAFASRLVALAEFVALGVALAVTSVVATNNPFDDVPDEEAGSGI
jgi:hypothetical protein